SRDPRAGYPAGLIRAALAAATALAAAACAGSAARPDAAVVQSLAPGGKLRVGVYAGSPTSMVRDARTGEPRGVSYELGRELASPLGVAVGAAAGPRVAA